MLVDRAEYDPESKQLAVCGYLREGLTCKEPYIHLTGHGDFPLVKIVAIADPLPPKNLSQEASGTVLDHPGLHEEHGDGAALRPYDPTEAEQTWPTDAEMRQARRVRVRMPKGAGNTELE